MQGEMYDVDAMVTEIDRLQGRCLKLQAHTERLEAEARLLRRYRVCHDALLVAYRTGKRPRDKVLDELAELRSIETTQQGKSWQ
jgi:hypothetical protein